MADRRLKGMLVTEPDGTISNIPADELQKFGVPLQQVEKTILEAEAAGFVQPTAR